MQCQCCTFSYVANICCRVSGWQYRSCACQVGFYLQPNLCFWCACQVVIGCSFWYMQTQRHITKGAYQPEVIISANKLRFCQIAGFQSCIHVNGRHIVKYLVGKVDVIIHPLPKAFQLTFTSCYCEIVVFIHKGGIRRYRSFRYIV